MSDAQPPQRPTMRVLIVASLFPPENTISALRLGKFAKYLAAFGDRVEVVTRIPPSAPPDQSAESDPFRVTRYPDPLARVERAVKATTKSGARPNPTARFRDSLIFTRTRRRATRALTWPDRFIFWAAVSLYKSRNADLHPDVIVASGPPLSALLVGSVLARRYGCPWVADYRDLLAFGTYSESGRLRTRVERALEKRVVRSASEIVTVSAPLARDLEKVFGKEVHVVKNGYDPADFPAENGQEGSRPHSGELCITYCGEIYPGKRDPSPLFAAMAQLDAAGTPVHARFYGSGAETLRGLVDQHSVGHLVELNPRIPHAESLAIQRRSDVLLLLMWDDPREEGVYSGKIFEYLGARRPILMLGYEHGVAADLVVTRGAGVVANAPDDIASALRIWAGEHARAGISDLPPTVALGLTRRDQTQRLRQILRAAVEGSRG